MLLHFSRAVVFGFFFRFGARVVFLELVDRFLVVVDFLEQSLEVRQLDLGLDREIEDALANGGVDDGARHGYVVFCSPAVEFDPVRDLHAIDGAIIVVKNFFVHASDGSSFFHDQVCLRIEEHAAFHASGAGQLDLQSIFAVNLRVAHKRQGYLLLLWIHEPRVVIASGCFELHSFGSDESVEFPRRVLPPSRFAVVGFNLILVAQQQFLVIAIRKFGIERVSTRFFVVCSKDSFEGECLDFG